MKTSHGKRFKLQKGNALAEMIVLTGIMVPVFGVLPMLGKISDVNNATVQSSRYVAWERTVSGLAEKSTEDISTEVNNRFFAKPDNQLRSNQGALTGDDAENPFWSGFGRNDDDSTNRLVRVGEGLFVDEVNEKPSSLVGDLSSGIKTVGDVMSSFTGGEWDLEDKGLFTAKVGIEVGGNKFLAGDKDCGNADSDDTFACVRRSNTILVDGWEVADADHAERRTRTLVPAAGLREIGDKAAQIIGMVPFFKDLGKLEADSNGGFGYIDSTVVPLDRYVD